MDTDIDTQPNPEMETRERRSGDRRQHRSKIVLHERRSGFDRRQGPNPGPWDSFLLFVRGRPVVLLAVLVAANALNALDAVFTLRALKLGYFEANPLLGALMHVDLRLAVAAKLLVVLLASFAVWRLRKHRIGVAGGTLVLATYAIVTAYHLIGQYMI